MACTQKWFLNFSHLQRFYVSQAQPTNSPTTQRVLYVGFMWLDPGDGFKFSTYYVHIIIFTIYYIVLFNVQPYLGTLSISTFFLLNNGWFSTTPWSDRVFLRESDPWCFFFSGEGSSVDHPHARARHTCRGYVAEGSDAFWWQKGRLGHWGGGCCRR